MDEALLFSLDFATAKVEVKIDALMPVIDKALELGRPELVSTAHWSVLL